MNLVPEFDTCPPRCPFCGLDLGSAAAWCSAFHETPRAQTEIALKLQNWSQDKRLPLSFRLHVWPAFFEVSCLVSHVTDCHFIVNAWSDLTARTAIRGAVNQLLTTLGFAGKSEMET